VSQMPCTLFTAPSRVPPRIVSHAFTQLLSGITQPTPSIPKPPLPRHWREDSHPPSHHHRHHDKYNNPHALKINFIPIRSGFFPFRWTIFDTAPNYSQSPCSATSSESNPT